MRQKVFLFFLFLEFNVLIKNINAFNDVDVEEGLMDLSISELLRLKHSMQRMEEEGSFQDNLWEEYNMNHTIKEETTISKPKPDNESCASQNCLKPMAMALTGIPREYYDHSVSHHSNDPWQTEEKQSKLTTLFNITITALSILSFGGYLLCLIVHAIKSKGATFYYPVTTASTTEVDDGIRKIKVYRRGRRSLKEQHSTPSYDEFYKDFGQTIKMFQNNQLF